jgi:hypothetical protein
MMQQYGDARFALRVAFGRAPAAVGWKAGGWIVYNPVDGAPDGVQPEMLVLRLGQVPIALSDNGAGVLESALRSFSKG